MNPRASPSGFSTSGSSSSWGRGLTVGHDRTIKYVKHFELLRESICEIRFRSKEHIMYQRTSPRHLVGQSCHSEVRRFSRSLLVPKTIVSFTCTPKIILTSPPLVKRKTHESVKHCLEACSFRGVLSRVWYALPACFTSLGSIPRPGGNLMKVSSFSSDWKNACSASKWYMFKPRSHAKAHSIPVGAVGAEVRVNVSRWSTPST